MPSSFSMTQPAPASPAPTDDAGLRIIIAYKAAKGITWLILAIVLGVALKLNLTGMIQDGIVRAHTHLAHMWAIRLADWLFLAATRSHLVVIGAALVLDGLASCVEAWALHHRKPWGEWLVVITTSSLLPLEVWELIRKLSVGRVILLVLNVIIVVYLVLRIRRQRAADQAMHSSAAATTSTGS